MICISSGLAGDGALQPVAPGRRLVVEAGVHQREQGERGVADPAEAVIPVALAAELLRQRGGGRGDDAAGRRVGQRLQRDQRALDRLGVGPVGLGARRPVAPEALAVRERLGGSIGSGTRQVRRAVAQHEGHGLALGTRELRRRSSCPRRAARPGCAAPPCRGRQPRAARRRRMPRRPRASVAP